jgi:KDO2-lipid IV(A) lauroyltransferase
MIYWLTRAATTLAGRVPRRPRLWLAGSLATLVYSGWATKRRVTDANMAQILGTSPTDPRARQLARASWRNYGRYVSDFFALSGMGAAARTEVSARWCDTSPPPGAYPWFDEAQARGKGVLIVTPHFGAWDVAGIVVANHLPLHVLVERFADPRMDALVKEQRRAIGMELLRLEQSPRRILRVLHDNGAVAIVVDRPLPSSEGVPVTFFGRRCYVPGGVAQLALLSGAAVVAGYACYDRMWSRTYYAGLLPPFVATPTGDRQADIIAVTQRIFDALEAIIRVFPDQWYMFRPFWPLEPAASAADDATSHANQAATPAQRTAQGRYDG